ncbi:NAD-dependent arabinose dehydrogenase [Saitoella complicata NRRL Y-17804]|nr:NAD-dependent arabinose dehydrogenase [Saitoella complicata NRRL Y-17804]ODQ53705.1 NAD-dependent arabinose dehydrogenase [Saitoella complicata NRRL Y-17804]
MTRQLEPLGPVAAPVNGSSLAGMSPLCFGAGTFAPQYNEPALLRPTDVVRRALDLAVNCFDTSPYYGESEIILGDALQNLSADYPRNTYYISTKCGREPTNEFDYTPSWIRKSVERSLERLHTSYLDVVYVHDVEFKTEDEAVLAVKTLFELKQEGKILNVGFSGYPLPVLVSLAERIVKEVGKPVDAIITYSNFNIANTVLLKYLAKLSPCVGQIISASPFSMGLLSSREPPKWHPGSPALKAAVAKAAAFCDVELREPLADLATRFALEKWEGVTLVGCSTVDEVDSAVANWWKCQDKAQKEKDEVAFRRVREVLGDQLDVCWPSGRG